MLLWDKELVIVRNEIHVAIATEKFTNSIYGLLVNTKYKEGNPYEKNKFL